MSFSKKRILFYTFFSIFLITVMVISLIFYRITDIDFLKNGLVHEIESMTDLKVTIGNAELAVDKGVGIILREVSLRKDHQLLPALTAKEIWVDIGLLPLLAQEVVIEKMLMRGSTVKVVRTAVGEIDLVGFNGFNIQKGIIGKNFIKVVKMGVLPQLVIQGGHVEFIDYWQDSNPVPVNIKGLDISVYKTFAKPSFSVSLRGHIPHKFGNARVALSGDLKNLQGGWDFSQLILKGHVKVQELSTQPFIRYLSASIEEKNLFISTDLNFSWELGGEVHLAGNLKYSPRQKNRTPVLMEASSPLLGVLDYKVNYHEGSLEIENAAFKMGDYELQGQASIASLGSENPRIRFHLNSGGIRVKDLQDYPPFNGFPQQVQLIQETFQRGKLRIKTLDFEGDLDQLNHLDSEENLSLLSGEVELDQVNWGLPFVKLHRITGTFGLGSGRGRVRIQKAFSSHFPKIRLTGRIDNILNHPVGDLSFGGPLTLLELKELLKTEIPRKAFHEMLDRYEHLSGKGQLKLRFAGSLESMDRLTIKGGYDIKNGHLELKRLQYPIDRLKGRIEFEHQPITESQISRKVEDPWKIRVIGLKGRLGKNSFSDINGRIRFFDEQPDLKATGKLEVRMKDIPRLLPASLRTPSFDSLLNEVDFLGGTVSAHFKGESDSLSIRPLVSELNLEFKQVGFRIPKAPQSFRNFTGRMSISRQDILLTKLSGYYGKSPLTLNGKVMVADLKSAPKFDVQVASSGFDFGDMGADRLLRAINFKGPVPFKFHGMGSLEDIEFQGEFDLAQAAYQFKQNFIKPKQTANRLLLDGRWNSTRTITFKKMEYRLGANSVFGSGTIRLAKKPSFSLRLYSPKIKSFYLATHVPELETNRSGVIGFDFAGKGELERFSPSMFKGKFHVKDLEFDWEGFTHPVFINAQGNLINDQVNVSSGTIAASDSSLQFSGKKSWGEQPALDLAVRGDELDFNDVWPGVVPLDKIRSYFEDSIIFNKGIGRVSVSLDHYEYLFWDLKKINGDFLIKDRAIHINNLDIVCPNNNRIQTWGRVALNDSRNFEFKSVIQTEDIEASDFLGQMGTVFQNGLSGKVNWLKAHLESEGNNFTEVIQALKGKLKFDLVEGDLNVHQLKRGVNYLFGEIENPRMLADAEETQDPYETIAGEFLIKKGIARTENYIFETPQRRTSLVGAFDLNEEKMDTVVGVAPLAALDKLLTKIPVLGKIITAGDEASLVKTYYTVIGPFESPEVSSIPWTSLEKRVLGIFQGIFETPQDLILTPLNLDTGG